MPRPRARFGFRAKLTMLAAGLVTVPLTVAGLSLIDVNADTVKTSSRELQLAILEETALTIDGQLREAEGAVLSVARAFADDQQPAAARLGMAVALIEAAETLDHVDIFDADGRRIDTIREAGVASAAAEVLPDELRAAATREAAAVGEVDLAGGLARIPVVAAIRAGGKVTGYCASLVALARVQARVERITEARYPDGAGAIVVLDDRLRTIAHPDREQIGALAGAGIRGWVNPSTLSADVAVSGEFTELDGKLVVGSVTRMGRYPFILVAEVGRDVAYASLGRMERTVLLIFGGSLLLSIAAAFLVARRISKPVETLSAYAGALAQRRFAERVTVETGDELSTLARAMNGAAAALAESEVRIREEVAIRGDLGRYLPGELVDKVVRREQDMALGGERRSISVLFADVVGFTPLTERLGAEEVVSLLNELFTILTEIVFRHGGTVDKFVGDCVMAIWGAPAPQEDHARRALAAAADMMSWLEAGNAAWQARLDVQVELAIGVSCGEAVVGNIGSDTRMEYTAIGEVVNTAARLESVARPRQILITGAVRAAAGEAFAYVDLGEKALPGRAAPLHLYEVRP